MLPGSVQIDTHNEVHMTEKAQVQLSRSIKAQVVTEIAKRMKRGKVSQSDLARRMGTSRAVVHRLLKRPRDTSLTLSTLTSALVALKLTATVRLTPAKPAKA